MSEDTYRNTEHVRLIVGLKKYPGTNTATNAESGIQEINFDALDKGGGGFTIANYNDNWRPGRPGLKSGGIYTDNSGEDGRLLRNAHYDNVRADLTVTIKGTSYQDLAARVARLQLFIRRAHTFSTMRSQNDPVYLEWKALGASIAQYARVYDIEIGMSRPDANSCMQTATLTFTREPYWSPIPPGANPILYKMITGDNGIVSQDEGDYDLTADTFASASAVLQNRMEYDAGTGGDNAILTQNFIDIPADEIPGDAPATCMIVTNIHADAFQPKTYYIARDVRPDLPFVQPTGLSNPFFDYPMMAGGDAGWQDIWNGTPVKVSGTGLFSNGSVATRYVTDVTMPTTALTDTLPILVWGSDDVSLDEVCETLFHTMGLRGKYAVFMRGNVQSGSGNDIDLYLRFTFEPDANVITNQGVGNVIEVPPAAGVNPITIATQRNAEDSYALLYFGVVDIPTLVSAGGGLSGIGLDNDNNSRFFIELRNRVRGTASAMEFRILDLILIKMDEAFAMIELQAESSNPFESTVNTYHFGIYDNTGYFNHGKSDAVAVGFRGQATANRNTAFLELRGQEIVLEPGIRNRLWLLNDEHNANDDEFSDWQTAAATGDNRDMNVHVFVVPRWIGAIDI